MISPSIAEVYPNLFIGDIDAAKAFNYLHRNNFTKVINLSGIPVYYTGLTPVITNVPNIEDKPHNIAELIQLCHIYWPLTKEIDKELNKLPADRSTNRVLVNCHAGINRSALLIALYLKLHKCMPPKKIVGLLEKANEKRQLEVLTNHTFRDLILTPI